MSFLGLPHSSCCLEIWRQKDQQNWSRYHTIFRHVQIFLVFACTVFATKEVKKFELRILLKVFHNGEAEAEQVVIAMESDPTSSQLWVFKVNRAELVQLLGSATWFSAHVSTRKYWCFVDLVAEKYSETANNQTTWCPGAPGARTSRTTPTALGCGAAVRTRIGTCGAESYPHTIGFPDDWGNPHVSLSMLPIGLITYHIIYEIHRNSIDHNHH